jgi:dihydroxyacetone kinase
MSARKLIYNNAGEAAVQEGIAGLLAARGDLRCVAGTANVIARADLEEYRLRRVTVLCGGGAGHEPAHTGYIGDGMLSCAVLGNVFASPSADSVYRGIMACASPLGVLVLVKNYTGDRLNFGMAVERARAAGVLVRMLIVGDDCTQTGSGSVTGRRGVAGTLLVQKAAGARAHHDGASLDEVYAAAEAASRAVRTMGIGLTSCSLPGKEKSGRLGGAEMEVGIGIHGEPGRSICDAPATGLATAMAATIVGALVDDMRTALGGGGDGDGGGGGGGGSISIGRVAVMVNNLGVTTELEMCAFVAALLPVLREHSAVVERLYVGESMLCCAVL